MVAVEEEHTPVGLEHFRDEGPERSELVVRHVRDPEPEEDGIVAAVGVPSRSVDRGLGRHRHSSLGDRL
jgi:hypothetical protein